MAATSQKSGAENARRKTTGSKSSREKLRAHRLKLRKLGLRPIQIWVPDTRSEAFAREARRQARLAARSAHAAADQAFVDAISEWPNTD